MAAGTHAFPTFPACVSATPPHPTPKICHKVRLGDTIRVMATILRLRRRAIHAKHTAPSGAFFIPPRRSSRRARNKSLKKALIAIHRKPHTVLHRLAVQPSTAFGDAPCLKLSVDGYNSPKNTPPARFCVTFAQSFIHTGDRQSPKLSSANRANSRRFSTSSCGSGFLFTG